MMRSLCLALLMVVALVACNGEEPGASSSPQGEFSVDLLRLQEWEIYNRWVSLHPEVRGRVVDPDGNPQSGATVSVVYMPPNGPLAPLTTDTRTTDEKGGFRFGEVPANAFLLVEYEGYASGMLDLRFLELADADGGGLELPLRHGAEITGVVRLPDGTPMPQARLLSLNAQRDWFATAETDDQGRYRIPYAPPGELMVMVLPGGPIGQTTNLTIEAGRPVTADIQVRGFPAIHGRVVSADSGAPVAGALVRASMGHDVFVKTDDDGRFTFEHLYMQAISIIAPGYAERSERIDPFRTEEMNLTVKLNRGVTARGLVVDEQGDPVAGARVFAVVDVEASGRHLRGPLTDARGLFEWSWLEPSQTGGKIVLCAKSPGSLPVTSQVLPIAPGRSIDGIVLTIVPPSRVRFRLIDERGEPIARAQCVLEPDLVAVLPGVKPYLRAGGSESTSSDGVGVALGLHRGRHILSVHFDERIPFTTYVNVGPGATDLGDITIPDLLAIGGRVVSTGGALPDMVKAFLSIAGEESRAEVRIGKDGKFRIGGLEDRPYLLQLAATDHRTVTREYPAGTEDLEIRLTQLGTLKITPLLDGVEGPEGRIELVREGGKEPPVVRYFSRPGETVEVKRLTPGSWFVRIKARSYYGRLKMEVVGGKSESVEVSLLSGGTLYGSVLRPDGKPASGIGIQYDVGEDWGVHGVAVDEQGRYRLVGIPSGAVKLLTHPRGFVPLEVSLEVQSGQEIRRDLTLDAGGRFDLLVTGLDGQPLSRVKVGLAEEEGEPASYWIEGHDRTATNEKGKLSLTGIPPGRYRLSLHIKDELWESRPVDIAAGANALTIEIDR